MKLAVSILSSNYSEVETIKRVNETNADYLHVDVMDGKFVLEKSQKYEFLHISKKPLQVHLMVSNPFNYISQFAIMNTDSITFPIEINDDINGLLNHIKASGLKCGLALNPETSVESITKYLDKLDIILILSVHPGKGGQSMLDSTLYKIDILKKIRSERGYHYEIMIDGGVNEDSIDKVRSADIVVSGSYICKSDDFQARIDKLNL